MYNDTPSEKERKRPVKFHKSTKYKINSLSVPDNLYDDDENLFCDNDTPIRRLPHDCLAEIFKLCGDAQTLLRVSRVCRSWRKLVHQPMVWKDISCQWVHFHQQLNRLSKSVKSSRQFGLVQELTIYAHANTGLQRHHSIRTISPFTHLHTLQLNDMTIGGIEYITDWMTHIHTLKCNNIVTTNNGNAYIPNLSKLYQLETLYLQFAKPSSLTLGFFIDSPEVRLLPSSLQHLTIKNIKDVEEHMITAQDASNAAQHISSGRAMTHWDNPFLPDEMLDFWLTLENTLVLKYTMLSYLSNLKTLSLDSVSSFTAKVWRQCLIPCSSKLEHVSLSNWSGKRESPQAMLYTLAQPTDLQVRDIDLALSEFIASLTKIQSIRLDQFVCTSGFIMGLKGLQKKYQITDFPKQSISLFLDKSLYEFKIEVIN